MLICAKHRSARTSAHSRAGLAPVELVLALPIWMMIAALMVLVATTGTWRIRAQAASREAAFRSVWPRNRAQDGNPREWSVRSATMNSSVARPEVLIDDPLAGHAVIRGPDLVEPVLRTIVAVDPTVMPTSNSVIRGESSLNRGAAVWPKSGYRYRMTREFPVLSGEAGQFIAESPNLHNRRRADQIWNIRRFVRN